MAELKSRVRDLTGIGTEIQEFNYESVNVESVLGFFYWGIR